MSADFNWSSYLGGIASGLAIFAVPIALWRWSQGRLAPKVSVECDVAVTERVNPPDRYHVWGGNRTKRYTLIRVENPSTNPFLFLRGKLEIPGKDYPLWLSKKNEGVELAPKEATHFQYEVEQVGDLRGARLTITSHGFEKTYRL